MGLHLDALETRCGYRDSESSALWKHMHVDASAKVNQLETTCLTTGKITFEKRTVEQKHQSLEF